MLTLTVDCATTPATSVTFITLNPDASLKSFGILEFWKLKLILEINPLDANISVVVNPYVIPSHPDGQQFVCMFATAA